MPLLLVTTERLLCTVSGEVEVPHDGVPQRLEMLQSFWPHSLVLRPPAIRKDEEERMEI
jgi:hypothetical protein